MAAPSRYPFFLCIVGILCLPHSNRKPFCSTVDTCVVHLSDFNGLLLVIIWYYYFLYFRAKHSLYFIWNLLFYFLSSVQKLKVPTKSWVFFFFFGKRKYGHSYIFMHKYYFKWVTKKRRGFFTPKKTYFW